MPVGEKYDQEKKKEESKPNHWYSSDSKSAWKNDLALWKG